MTRLVRLLLALLIVPVPLWAQGAAISPPISTGATIRPVEGYISGTGSAIGAIVIPVLNLITTSTDGLTLQNTTAATAGVTVQISPRLRWQGTAWDTAASQTMDFWAEVLPVSAATPSGSWRLVSSLNGGGTTNVLQVNNGGIVTSGGLLKSGGVGVESPATGIIYWLTRSEMTSPATGQWNLTTAAENAGIGLDVATDAVMKVRVRAQNAYATIDALALNRAGIVTISGTAPTINAGFAAGGGGATIGASNGTAAFTIVTGTADTGSTGTLNLPTATTGWSCSFADVTTPATYIVSQTGGATNTVTVTNYSRTVGTAAAWLTTETIRAQCLAY